MAEQTITLTPLEAANVIAGVERDATFARARAAGYVDMLWGLLLPALVFTWRSFDDMDSAWAPVSWCGIAIGGLVLSFLVTRNEAIGLAPPVRSVWFWIVMGAGPAILGIITITLFFAVGRVAGGHGVVVPPAAGLTALLAALPFLGAACYVVGRGIFLWRQPWHGKPWAVLLGAALVVVAAAVAGMAWVSLLPGNRYPVLFGWSLGIVWFGHGILLYNRG